MGFGQSPTRECLLAGCNPKGMNAFPNFCPLGKCLPFVLGGAAFCSCILAFEPLSLMIEVASVSS